MDRRLPSGAGRRRRAVHRVTLSAVPLRMQNTADELIRMMSTHSFYEQLAPEQRQALGAEYRRSSVGGGGWSAPPPWRCW